MHKALFGGLLLGLLVVGPASAALIINVGSNDVLPNATGQVVEIYATGFVGGDPQVSGFNLLAQLGDGSGGGAPGTDFDEPVFQSVDFTGGIWDAHATTLIPPSDPGVVDGAEYWAAQSVVFSAGGVAVDADGLIATLEIDTTGYAAGTIFDLKLAGTPLGDSDYVGQAAVITNGTINLVPEPAAMVQLFGLMAAIGPWYWLRKRNRNR